MVCNRACTEPIQVYAFQIMAWEKRDINASGLIDLRCWIRSRQMAGRGDHAYLVAGWIPPSTFGPLRLEVQYRGYVSIFGPRSGASCHHCHCRQCWALILNLATLRALSSPLLSRSHLMPVRGLLDPRSSLLVRLKALIPRLLLCCLSSSPRDY